MSIDKCIFYMKTAQRDATCKQILTATLSAISEAGFDGVSTREIARRANVSQGLLTYHFKSKDVLWRAAADYVFSIANDSLRSAISTDESNDPREHVRKRIREMVYFHAEHPEFMRFMIDQGGNNPERSQWLTDTHVRPMFERFTLESVGFKKQDLPHAFYTLAGACGVIFCLPQECQRATGVNPESKAAIKRHADFVANLMVPP